MVEFSERFVFVYDASIEGRGIQQDVYEMFEIDNFKTFQLLYENKIIKIKESQYNEIAKAFNKDEDYSFYIVVFYELNMIPVLFYWSDDYMEVITTIEESEESYLKKSNFLKKETKATDYNWAKNNLKLKFLRHKICDINNII